ncbi:hypothetical protein TWF281_002187 [Arthrobotrys megalospora]
MLEGSPTLQVLPIAGTIASPSPNSQITIIQSNVNYDALKSDSQNPEAVSSPQGPDPTSNARSECVNADTIILTPSVNKLIRQVPEGDEEHTKKRGRENERKPKENQGEPQPIQPKSGTPKTLRRETWMKIKAIPIYDIWVAAMKRSNKKINPKKEGSVSWYEYLEETGQHLLGCLLKPGMPKSNKALHEAILVRLKNSWRTRQVYRPPTVRNHVCLIKWRDINTVHKQRQSKTSQMHDVMHPQSRSYNAKGPVVSKGAEKLQLQTIHDTEDIASSPSSRSKVPSPAHDKQHIPPTLHQSSGVQRGAVNHGNPGGRSSFGSRSFRAINFDHLRPTRLRQGACRNQRYDSDPQENEEYEVYDHEGGDIISEGGTDEESEALEEDNELPPVKRRTPLDYWDPQTIRNSQKAPQRREQGSNAGKATIRDTKGDNGSANHWKHTESNQQEPQVQHSHNINKSEEIPAVSGTIPSSSPSKITAHELSQ